MTHQSGPHDVLAWAKQRLEEADAMITGAEARMAGTEDAVRAKAEAAVAALRGARAKLNDALEALKAEAAQALEAGAERQKAVIEAWVDVETAFQGVMTAFADRSEAARALILARIDAQRTAWRDAVTEAQGLVAQSFDAARGELAEALERLDAEVDKLEARGGALLQAGEQSREVLKTGLAEIKAVQKTTLDKIRAAFDART